METTAPVTGFQCNYCQKQFQRERSLEVHVCEQKRRYREREERGVQLGFQAYIKFYEMAQGSARLKTYDDFATSQYYRAFVKFGRHCVNLRAINPPQLLDWLLKNNKKIDHWCRDSMYEEWLHYWLPRENIQDALERGMTEIQEYVAATPDLRNGVADYFRYGNANRICYHISTGRVSPWVVYNCDSGREFLDQLIPEQLAMVMPRIDPEIWAAKFAKYPADQEWARHILATAGL